MDFLDAFYTKINDFLGVDKGSERMEHLKLIYCGLFNFTVSATLFADKITIVEENKKPFMFFLKQIRNEMVHGTDVNISFYLDLKKSLINSECIVLDTKKLKDCKRFKSKNKDIDIARGYLDTLKDNISLEEIVNEWYKYIEEKYSHIVNDISKLHNLP
jgi:hypothetical protein